MFEMIWVFLKFKKKIPVITLFSSHILHFIITIQIPNFFLFLLFNNKNDSFKRTIKYFLHSELMSEQGLLRNTLVKTDHTHID